jgi:hypothetical protein
MIPYLRALATRSFREHSDAEDAVEDVPLTVRAIRHTYVQASIQTVARRRI